MTDGPGLLVWTQADSAPGAKILPVKVSVGTDEDVDDQPLADGIVHAVRAHAQVISISLGPEDDPCDDPVAAAAAVRCAYDHDVIVVASAGNEKHAVENPANCPGVLAITAINPNHKPWSDNSHGTQVAFATAGADTVAESVTGSGIYGGGGTSDATEIAAGMFALLRAAYPDESARQIVSRVLWNTTGGCARPDAFVNVEIGYGVIDTYDSITEAPPPTAPNPIYDAWAKVLGPPSDVASVPATTPRNNAHAIAPCSVAIRNNASGRTRGVDGTGPGATAGVILVLVAGVLIRGRGERHARRR